MFVQLIQKNVLPKSVKDVRPSSADDFDGYLEKMLPSLLAKILGQFKTNLSHVTRSKDGLYCILFIKNAI